MARMARCNATGVVGNSSGFYKVDNKYYQSEDVYKEFMGDKAYRKDIIKKIMDLLGYDSMLPSKLGTLIGKKMRDSKYSSKELYESLIDKEEYIRETFGEIINHYEDVQRIIAIFTIISTIPQSVTYGGCYKI